MPDFFAVNINSFFPTCFDRIIIVLKFSFYWFIVLFWGAIMLISTITKSRPIDILTQGLFIDFFFLYLSSR